MSYNCRVSSKNYDFSLLSISTNSYDCQMDDQRKFQ